MTAGNSILARVVAVENTVSKISSYGPFVTWASGNTERYVLREIGGVVALFLGKSGGDWTVDPADQTNGPTNWDMSLVPWTVWNSLHANYYTLNHIVLGSDNIGYRLLDNATVDPATPSPANWAAM